MAFYYSIFFKMPIDCTYQGPLYHMNNLTLTSFSRFLLPNFTKYPLETPSFDKWKLSGITIWSYVLNIQLGNLQNKSSLIFSVNTWIGLAVSPGCRENMEGNKTHGQLSTKPKVGIISICYYIIERNKVKQHEGQVYMSEVYFMPGTS